MLNPRNNILVGRLARLRLKFSQSVAIETLLDAASRHRFTGCSYSSLSAASWQHSLGFNFRYFDVSNVFSTVIQTCASLGYTDLSVGNLTSGEHCWMLASPA